MSCPLKPILRAIEVPAKTEFLGDGIELIARVELLTDDMMRFPEETECFFVLQFLAKQAREYGIEALMAERAHMGCARSLELIPPTRCWGGLEEKRERGSVIIAVFNRLYLNRSAVVLLKAIFRSICKQYRLDVVIGARKRAEQYRVEQFGDIQSPPPGTPRVVACIDAPTGRVKAVGLVFPDNPSTVHYPLGFIVKSNTSAVITLLLDHRPGSDVTSDELEQEMPNSISSKSIEKALYWISDHSPILLRLKQRLRSRAYRFNCTAVEAYEVDSPLGR
jgi:hypothetical protein